VRSVTGRQRVRGGAPVEMSITQLARKAGVPPRRVRYYVAESLLPPPVGRGRAAHYTPAHLDRLREILALREANLSLNQIRERLAPDEKSDPQPSQPREAGQWRRWKIAPGVEIHARDDLDTVRMAAVRVLVGVAHHILRDAGGEESTERTRTDR
jgi:DNA-binding transcriptional MerR regulator